jgi:excisionase family DNA binding protein
MSMAEQTLAAMQRDRSERLNGSPFLTVAEVAARLRVSTRTVHEMTRKNLLPLVHLAGTRKILVPVQDFELFSRGDYQGLVAEDLPDGGRRVRLVRNGSHA